MAYSFLSRFRIKTEHDDEFVALIDQMEAHAAAEADTLAYKFYRLDQDGGYAVYESFTDEAADKAHQANPATQGIIARMIEIIDGGYVREMLYDVKG
ncbi:putative quinol monooxygenase [Sphingomonas jaspsi]|uniref:putative quinol monooxygenase n=1 Tax=Sphingomonas jaspsi TaxID=392409 RepID=UPI0004B4CC05|nr:antibiotic biosynthesis monooxygenase [Sphingomonas jaspsi]